MDSFMHDQWVCWRGVMWWNERERRVWTLAEEQITLSATRGWAQTGGRRTGKADAAGLGGGGEITTLGDVGRNRIMLPRGGLTAADERVKARFGNVRTGMNPRKRERERQTRRLLLKREMWRWKKYKRRSTKGRNQIKNGRCRFLEQSVTDG